MHQALGIAAEPGAAMDGSGDIEADWYRVVFCYGLSRYRRGSWARSSCCLTFL